MYGNPPGYRPASYWRPWLPAPSDLGSLTPAQLMLAFSYNHPET